MVRKCSGSQVVAIAALLASCAGPTRPSTSDSLQLTVSPAETLVGSGSMATFTMRLTNIGTQAITLTFPSSCQIVPHFTDRSGRDVVPVGGGFACLTVLTSLTLAPGESTIRMVDVREGDQPQSPYVVMPEGEYAIYATLEDRDFRLRSAPVAFTLLRAGP